MSAAEQISIEEDESQAYKGPTAFAVRALELAKIATAFSEHAAQPLSRPGGNSVIELAKLANQTTIKNYDLANAIPRYNARLTTLEDLYTAHPSDVELFKKIFDFEPTSPIKIERLSIGVVIWCDEDDYIDCWLHNSPNPSRARERAISSSGASFGNSIIEGQEIGLALVKYTHEDHEYWEEAVPKSLEFKHLDSLFVGYWDGDKKNESIIMFSDRTETGQPTVIKIVDLIQQDEHEEHVNAPFEDQTPLNLTRGPYDFTFANGKVQIETNGKYQERSYKLGVTPTTEFIEVHDLNDEYLEPHLWVRDHEVRHMINDIFHPVRTKFRKALPYRAPEEDARKDLGKEFIHTVIDPLAQDEYLAQIVGGTAHKQVSSLMRKQVERLGISYNYIDDSQGELDKIIGRSYPDANWTRLKHLIAADIAADYPALLDEVTKKFIKETSAEKPVGKLSVTGLANLLAFHPFHTWPTVLRAVNRLGE